MVPAINYKLLVVAHHPKRVGDPCRNPVFMAKTAQYAVTVIQIHSHGFILETVKKSFPHLKSVLFKTVCK
jgi:hypothetical protein